MMRNLVYLPYAMPYIGIVTMTTEVGKNSATTLTRMNFSGYVVHVTIYTVKCCLVVVVRVRIRVRIRFIVWLVSGCAHVYVLFSVVIVTLPITYDAYTHLWVFNVNVNASICIAHNEWSFLMRISCSTCPEYKIGVA